MAAADEPWNLRPFEGVGPLRFGMTRERVHSVLGRPDRERQGDEETPPEEDYFEAGVGLVYTVRGGLAGVECNPQREVVWGDLPITRRPLRSFRQELEARGVAAEWDEVEETLRIPAAGLQLYAPSPSAAFPSHTIQGVLCESRDYAEIAGMYA